MAAALAKLLRLASIVICLIVIASFVVFAAQQTKTASGEQQEKIASPTGQTVAPHKARESTIHRKLDEISGELTSPFAGIVSGASEWGKHIVELVLALLVYGFALGYIARFLRVRA